MKEAEGDYISIDEIPKKVEKKMADVLVEHIRGELESILGVGTEEWARGGNQYGIYMQSLLDIHLQPDIEVGMASCFRPVHARLYIHIFSLVAFFMSRCSVLRVIATNRTVFFRSDDPAVLTG